TAARATALQSLHGDFVVDPRNDDFAVARFVGLVDRQQIAIEDAYVDHAVAVDAQQIIGARAKEAAGQITRVLAVFLREDRTTGSDAPDDRQPGRFGQPDAARGARHHFDRAFACECFQVFFRGVRRFETELARDVGARRRIAGVVDVATDEIEDLRLAF